MELVVLAGGIGSRYGGQKQIEAIDDEENFILDYSIFDAIEAGFSKVIFVVSEKNYELVRASIGKRIENKIKVEYAIQNNDNIPREFHIPTERVKPFGTAHALLCAKDFINENFAVTNADDFYGKDSFKVLAQNMENSNEPDKFFLVGFKAKNTLSNFGAVKRGICKIKNGNLCEVKDYKIFCEDDKLFAENLNLNNNNKKMQIDDSTIVSMNMFGFTPKFLEYLESEFLKFLSQNKNDLSSCEFMLPSVVTSLIKQNLAEVKILETNSIWKGLTYKEDLPEVKKHINLLKRNKTYPTPLWK